MMVVLNVGRSSAVVERLLSAAPGSALAVCSVPSFEDAVEGWRRWRPDCWVCDGDRLPDDPGSLETLAAAVDGRPLFVYGSPPPSALPDRLDVRHVTADTVVEDVLAEGSGDRTDTLPTEMLLSVLGDSDDLVASLDRDGTYRSVSEELASVLDAPSSEVVGATLADYAPVSDAEALRERGVRAIETGAIQRYEGDGYRCRLVPEGDDRFRLVVRRSIDAPVGRRAEPAAFIDDVLDRLSDIFFVMDLDGRLLHWNDRLVEVTGYPDEEIASMSAMEFFVAEGGGAERFS